MGSSSYLGGKSVEKSSLRRSVENYDGKGSSSSVSSREVQQIMTEMEVQLQKKNQVLQKEQQCLNYFNY